MWALGSNVSLIRLLISALCVSLASPLVLFSSLFRFFLTYLVPYLAFPLRIE